MSRRLPQANLRPADLAQLKVLVVDDNRAVQQLIRDVLSAAGVGALEATHDGVEARAVIARWDPQIVFCDWTMPVMGGLELTRSIRRAAVRPDRGIPNPQVPVIMVTGRRSDDDIQAARKAGVNEFVMKPLTPAALLSRIQLVLTRPRAFVVSEDYIGPDRRRRAELSYSGPLRRTADPGTVTDHAERGVTRQTISVELEALSALIGARGQVDRDTLKMTCRVMQHTSFRARQVGDLPAHQAAMTVLDYVEAMGRPERCDAAVLETYFQGIGQLLGRDLGRATGAQGPREAA